MFSKITGLVIGLLLSASAQAAYYPAQKIFEIGGRVFTDPVATNGSLMILVGYTSTNTYASLRNENSSPTAAYQVPAGKQYRIVSLRAHNEGATSQCMATIAYGTNNVGFDSSSAPASIQYYAGNAGTRIVSAPVSSSVSDRSSAQAYVNFIVPAAMYPAIVASKCVIQVYGYEETL